MALIVGTVWGIIPFHGLLAIILYVAITTIIGIYSMQCYTIHHVIQNGSGADSIGVAGVKFFEFKGEPPCSFVRVTVT